MADVIVGTVKGTGDKTYSPAVGVTVTAGDCVSLVSGYLQLAKSTDRTLAKNVVGIAMQDHIPGPDATGTAGQKIKIGDRLAIRKVGSTWKLYKIRSGEKPVGVAKNAGKTGQTITYGSPPSGVPVLTDSWTVVVTGTTRPKNHIVDLGASLADATLYVVSSNPGKIKPISELTSGEYLAVVGCSDPKGGLHVEPLPLDNVT